MSVSPPPAPARTPPPSDASIPLALLLAALVGSALYLVSEPLQHPLLVLQRSAVPFVLGLAVSRLLKSRTASLGLGLLFVGVTVGLLSGMDNPFRIARPGPRPVPPAATPELAKLPHDPPTSLSPDAAAQSPRTPRPKAQVHTFPADGLTLALPAAWLPMPPAAISMLNDDLLARRPGIGTRYLGGFTRGTPPPGDPLGTDYLILQRTPGEVTAEQLLAQIPRSLEKNRKTFEDLLARRITASDIDSAYLDPATGYVILPLTGRAQSPSATYLIPLRRALLSISAHSAPERADTVLAEAHRAIRTLLITAEIAPGEDWRKKLRPPSSR